MSLNLDCEKSQILARDERIGKVRSYVRDSGATRVFFQIFCLSLNLEPSDGPN